MQGTLGVWFITLVKDARHTWNLVYYLSKGCEAHLESGLLPLQRMQGTCGVWFTTLVKDTRHTWSLVYYLSERYKAYLESGLLP